MIADIDATIGAIGARLAPDTMVSQQSSVASFQEGGI
jgi:hypothetical protein